MKKPKRMLLFALILMLFMFCGVTNASSTDHTVLASVGKNLSLNKEKATMYIGEKLTLQLNGCKGKVTWASSKSKVAKVNTKGIVTALKAGTVTITAIHKGESYSCKITVKEPSLKESKISLMVGDTYQIEINGTKAISYSSSKEDIVKVSSSGKVTAISSGTATVSVSCTNKKNYKCEIEVQSSNELSAKDIYTKCFKSIVEIDAGASLGSGFFISENMVVTNYHVIDEATTLKAKLIDGTEVEILKVCGFDKDIDLAILEVNYKVIPLELNTHGITMGEATYTIGSSLGLTNTFSDGMVTNTERIFDNVTYIQTNTAISPGNSGGPLINTYGEVMGVTTSSFTNGQNLNLAININHLKSINVDSPMSVSDFLNRNYVHPNINTGNNTNETTGAEKPNFSCMLYYGDSYKKSRVCLVSIENRGSKDLIIGGSNYKNIVLVYPYSKATSSMGYLIDETTLQSIPSVTFKPGEKGYFVVKLDEYRYFFDGATICFNFTYDDIAYVGVTDDAGFFLWDKSNS